MKYLLLIIGIVLLASVFYMLLRYNGNNSQEKVSNASPSYINITNNSNEQTPSDMKNSTESSKSILNKIYEAVLHTSEGDIILELNGKDTPITVNNFVTLAQKNFYNNTIFYRVIKDFMIQGGDPKGDGTGDPGYKFNDEPFTGEYERGVVAMANSGPNTNGSQFFIMHKTTPLQKLYVIFGKVTKGMEVVDKIAESEVKSNGGENSTPVNPAKITTIDIKEIE